MAHKQVSFEVKGTPLIKFQSFERINSLQKGKLYAKTLKYYRELEKETGNDEIGDEFEAMIHVNEGYFRRLDTGEEIPLLDTLMQTDNSDDFVFCMFGIYPSSNSFSFSDKQKEKMLSFGDTALVILDSDEFIKRVKAAAKSKGYEAHFGAVRYYDPTIDNANIMLSLLQGMWNIAFWKRDKYTYQQEGRFVFTHGNGEDHIDLDIGDISDISIVLPTKKVLSAMVEKKE